MAFTWASQVGAVHRPRLTDSMLRRPPTDARPYRPYRLASQAGLMFTDRRKGTVYRSLWPIVRRKHHRLRTPSGSIPLRYVVIPQVRGIPESCLDLLSEPSLTEMS